ncbi:MULTISPECIES: IclR family transcriptional regulator [unclassified Sphingomonas]|uniref:IclR family transcriptional regulator n=1 Tax=unclassified Sphingomonas TaxID=196159 RepID=UPI00031D5C6B|nr:MULTISPECIES: IclR family transcriptional regulator [unclassified Sphingomonas]KTF70225.1 transcriptional regulator [Sphingomonas sp. WG]
MTEEKAAPRAGTQTLERGLDLLDLLARRPRTIRELAAESGLTVSTARRLALALVDRGFVTDGRDGLRLGPKLMQLGVHAQERMSVVEVARDRLRALADATEMPAFLGERDGDHSVHLHRVGGAQRVVVNTPVGTRRPLPETSLGKALLMDETPEALTALLARWPAPQGEAGIRANLDAARTRGAVVHRSPPPDDLRAVAAPIRNAAGRIVAAISVVSPAQYVEDAALDGLVAQVHAAATEISAALGHPTSVA